MSEQKQETHQAPLPESLRKQLEKFKKDLWRIKITEAILAGFLGLIVSFALVFALERVWEMPGLLRLIILIAGVSLFAVFAPFWINRWVFKHRKEDQLAKLISHHYPDLGDRLLGVVELQDQKESQTALSPELREAAMLAVANDARNRDLDKAISSTWRNKLALGAMIAVSLSTIAFFIFPNAGKNSLRRWLMPLSDTERYTFTKIDQSDFDKPLYVPLDEPFNIAITLKDDTEQTPDFAEARYGSGKWNTFNYLTNKYDLAFKGKRSNGTVMLKVGDANHDIEVRPIRRPKISNIKGVITFPEYLQRESITEDFNAGQLEVLEGSTLAIKAKAERELKSAVVGPLLVDKYIDLANIEKAEIQGIDPTAIPKQTKQEISHSIDHDTISPLPFKITKDTFTLPISWTDKHGISGLRAIELNITALQDRAPSTYIQDAKKQIYMLHTEVLEFQMQAEDDYGIKSAGIDWNGSFMTPTANLPAKGAEQFILGDPYKTNATHDVSLDFKTRKIAPQKLDVRTWVEDYNPDIPRAYSEVLEVFLLTESEHANYQKERMKDALTDLEEAMQREQENLDENKRIEKELNDPKKADKAKKKLEDQQIKEQENKDDVKELAKKMEDIFKQSMKNKSIDPKTLKDMSDAAQKMKEMSDKDMPEIAKKLDDAQNQKNTKEKSKEDVKEAIKKQEELLKKMKETAKKAEDANKKLEAGTFVNRLKQAASNEEQIASNLIPDDGVYGGEFYSQLDPVRQRIFQSLFLQQQQTTADIRWIEEDLGFFYSRTQKEIHKKVLDAIRKSNITEELLKIENKIEQAHVFVPSGMARTWAKQLREWAKELDGNEDEGDSGGDGGDGGGSDNSEDKDFEFMLRLMKMIQTEQQLRARTRALEQSRRNAEGIPSPNSNHVIPSTQNTSTPNLTP